MLPEPLQSWRFVSEQDAPEKLNDLALDVDVLGDAVRNGVIRAQDVTPFHPVTARGYIQWSETVATLRQALVARDWTQGDPQNSPRVFAPDGKTSIMVVGGNSDTGVSLDLEPKTSRRRGPSTRTAVQCNGQQMLDVILELPASWQQQGPLTWVLLYHWSKHEPSVRAELSLPAEITEHGDISRWSHRIILPEQDLTSFEVPKRPAGPQDDVDFRIVEIQ